MIWVVPNTYKNILQKMINLSKQNECIVFEFTDNQHYLQDGKIECPVNSLTVIADTSNMITIRKAASNDILLSANYDDFGMSKADLIDWFKVNAFAAGGGSSIVEIYVGTSADTINPQTGVIDKKEGKKDWLNIAWKSDQGEYSLTKINLNEFIIEGEFASGVTSIEDGTVVGVVDQRQQKVITLYNDDGTSATTDDVLSVNESGFTVDHIQDAIDAKHANTIKLNGFISGLTEDLFDITSGNTITEAFMKIENKLYEDENTGLIFDESSDDIVVLNGGTY